MTSFKISRSRRGTTGIALAFLATVTAACTADDTGSIDECNPVACTGGADVSVRTGEPRLPPAAYDIVVRSGESVAEGRVLVETSGSGALTCAGDFAEVAELFFDASCEPREPEEMIIRVSSAELASAGPLEFDVEISVQGVTLGFEQFEPTYERFNPAGPSPECGPGCLQADETMMILAPVVAAAATAAATAVTPRDFE